jgi:hypothetical protein
MKRLILLLAGLPLLVAACTPTATVAPPFSTPTSSSAAIGSPQSSSTPVPSVAFASCSADQLNLTAGHTGGAAGTNYLTVFVELAQGPACTLADSPKVRIIGPGGAVLASSGDIPSTQFPLTFIDRYHIGWTADCRTFASGDLTARIEFSPTVVVALPIGDFRPSHCMQPSGQALFMSADQPPE